MITNLLTYGIKIPIHEIFEKDIELFGKNSTSWSDSYDEYD